MNFYQLLVSIVGIDLDANLYQEYPLLPRRTGLSRPTSASLAFCSFRGKPKILPASTENIMGSAVAAGGTRRGRDLIKSPPRGGKGVHNGLPREGRREKGEGRGEKGEGRRERGGKKEVVVSGQTSITTRATRREKPGHSCHPARETRPLVPPGRKNPTTRATRPEKPGTPMPPGLENQAPDATRPGKPCHPCHPASQQARPSCHPAGSTSRTQGS